MSRVAVFLGLFAHPDDEIFCAGGAMARYPELGAAPTQFAGRGSDTVLPTWQEGSDGSTPAGATTVIDVSDFVSQKMSALAAHRTQFPLPPDLLPNDLLVELLGLEHFVRVHPPIAPETDLLP